MVIRAAPFLEFSVESTPPGGWQLHQLGPQAINPGSLTGTANGVATKSSPFALAHSATYDDPRAHEAIAAWLRDRLRALGHVTPRLIHQDHFQVPSVLNGVQAGDGALFV
jgi:hypothetical protein